MSAVRRRVILFVALAAAVAATGWVASQDQVDDKQAPPKSNLAVSPREQRPAPNAAPEQAAELALASLKREPSEGSIVNLFSSRSWQPPPPVAAPAKQPPPPPPPPAAPPLPFTLFGQMLEGGSATAFLSGKDRSYAVKVGDVLDRTYRVDSITDSVVVLTYLPLKQQQTLQAGSN